MMGIEMVPETLVIFNQLTWLIPREDFINAAICQNIVIIVICFDSCVDYK
jgi:hypothetical protein